MATRSNKSKKNDPSDQADANEVVTSSEGNIKTLVDLLEEHRKSLSAEFKAAMSTFEQKLDGIQGKVNDHDVKITALEDSANANELRMLALEKTCVTLTEHNAKLRAKMMDIESRSRRNNIRIVGLPETTEGPQPTAFFSELLLEVFGEAVLGTTPECDRAHRVPQPKPRPDQKPRAVIICLHKYQTKEAIIREARAKRGKLNYRGNSIAVFEDYAPEVMEERYKYKEVMSKFYNLGLKPSLRYPARLTITTTEGNRKTFSDVTEAEGFVTSFHTTSNIP